MSQSKIFLLECIIGDVHDGHYYDQVGFTDNEEYAKEWCKKDPYCREYEEVEEITE